MSKSTTHSKRDWHPEDIKAAIRKKYRSVSILARANGYNNPSTFSNVFRMPYPKVEKIIAKSLDTIPEEIWPSRYKDKPTPKFNTVEPDHKLSRRVA